MHNNDESDHSNFRSNIVICVMYTRKNDHAKAEKKSLDL